MTYTFNICNYLTKDKWIDGLLVRPIEDSRPDSIIDRYCIDILWIIFNYMVLRDI